MAYVADSFSHLHPVFSPAWWEVLRNAPHPVKELRGISRRLLWFRRRLVSMIWFRWHIAPDRDAS
jgi:hypothetical protein